MSVYCCTGSEEHWRRSAIEFEQVASKIGEGDLSAQEFGLWGTSRPKKSARSQADTQWFSAKRGDRIVCYATEPVSGIIGIGEIYKKKAIDSREFIWEQEWQESQVVYPRLIIFEKLQFLDYRDWHGDCLPLANRGVTSAGIKRMRGDNDVLTNLRPMVRNEWNVKLVP